MNSLEDQLSDLGEKQRDLGDVTVTTDLDRIDRQVADQLHIRQQVWRLGQELETLGQERPNDTFANLEEWLKKSEKIAEVLRQLSELELSVSFRFSKLQKARELAKGLRGLKDQADTWLMEKDEELTQLELQSSDLSILNSAQALESELEDFTLDEMKKLTDELCDVSQERYTGGAEEEEENISAPVWRQSGIEDALEETTRHRDYLKGRVCRLLRKLELLPKRRRDALADVCDNVDQLVATAREIHSQRRLGSKRLKKTVNDLDVLFSLLLWILIGIAADVDRTVCWSFITAGTISPVNAIVVGGCIVAGVLYMQKKIIERSALDSAYNCIVKDRYRYAQLLAQEEECKILWQALLDRFPSSRIMDEYLRQCGTAVEVLRECLKEISNFGRRWRRYDFDPHGDAGIRRAKKVVRTFLQDDQYDYNYLLAVALFLDLAMIGAISYNAEYLKRSKPPIHCLLRIIVNGFEQDAAPAKRMADAPWLIPVYYSVSY